MFTSIFKDTMVTSNWLEVQKAGEEKQPVLFPLGVIEEHGPHLPLGADIYWSYSMCRMVKEKLKVRGIQSVIAPPYYWGVNHYTGEFPGSFSLKPDTMQQILVEILGNLKHFGFTDVYCFSYQRDVVHMKAIAKAITRANEELGMHVRLILEAVDLQLYGWCGEEDFLMISAPDYPAGWFEEAESLEQEQFDIHAGAFETAVMNVICPELVDLERTRQLKPTSLNREEMNAWLQGSKMEKKVMPLGYAGNPAGYEVAGRHVEEMLDWQVADIVNRILQEEPDAKTQRRIDAEPVNM